MPLYEYRCNKCGQHIEVLQKINDRPLRKCSECSGRLEKLISRTSFQLKGGGWFSSGYGDASGGNGKKPSTATPASDSSSKSGDSKKSPAKKSDDSGETKSSASSA